MSPIALLAAAMPKNQDPQNVSPGLAGFLTVFLLALAVVFLVRSMVKHLRNVRYGPGPQSPSAPESGSGLPSRSGPASDQPPQPPDAGPTGSG
jgi:hypothetical protein